MNNVAKLRKKAGISQQELGRLSGVPQGVISLIESGVTQFPRLDTAAKLARALGCTIDELLGETIDPDQPVRR
mgnify:CR=1 FL=1